MTTPKFSERQLLVWTGAMLTQLHRQNPDTEPSAHQLDRMASTADRITERFSSRVETEAERDERRAKEYRDAAERGQ